MTQGEATSHRAERGAATLWMVFGTVVVFAVCGLVFDGGSIISATRAAINDAEEAARAGAQAIDVAAIYRPDTRPVLDPTEAIARTEVFMTAQGWHGTATADATSVTVTITRDQPLTFLQTLGVTPRTITGTATAQAQQGFAGS